MPVNWLYGFLFTTQSKVIANFIALTVDEIANQLLYT